MFQEVIGAVSGAVVVDQPTPEATVFSPLNVAFTHRAVSDGVVMELWPDGASELLVDQDLSMGSGIFTLGDRRVVIRWESDTDGPAIAIFRSGRRRGVVAVTTVRVDLDPSRSVPDSATILGPVGDRRLDILYQQPDVRLSIYEPGECGDRPQLVIVTGTEPEPFPTYRNDFTGRGYVVVEAALRSPGNTGSLSDSMLVALEGSVEPDVTFIHSDAAMASIDLRYVLTGVITARSGRYRVDTSDLDSHLIPKKPRVITAES